MSFEVEGQGLSSTSQSLKRFDLNAKQDVNTLLLYNVAERVATLTVSVLVLKSFCVCDRYFRDASGLVRYRKW
jgi:hypothetical protein